MSTYVGSRRDEISAMLAEIGASLGDSPPHLAPPSAGTDSAEAVDARYIAAGEIREGSPPLRDDADTVEHTRQCRLRSYQRL